MKNLTGDVYGGLAAMLVALPSAIAFGIIIYAPLGAPYAGKAALAGIIGAISLGIIAPLFGGTPRLITAPCAPAAAVLSVFVSEMGKTGVLPVEAIPFLVCLIAFFAGAAQFIVGRFGGGRFIKYIPYPVVAGYLSGVGILILLGQLPKMIGAPGGNALLDSLLRPEIWNYQSLCIGLVTISVMILAPRIFKAIPAVILALLFGVGAYFFLSLFDPRLLSTADNSLIIGPVSVSGQEIFATAILPWTHLSWFNAGNIALTLIPVLTLAVLLSIDTLKTCVILDVLTHDRHDSNRELMGQGLGNMTAAIAGGIPGSGTMGPTLVNVASGGKTRLSGMLAGVFAALALLMLGRLMAWIPLAALAGVLMVIAFRMIDTQSLKLLRHRGAIFDFLVILAVIVAAVSTNLIVAAGVGTAMAILLFLREQIRFSVIRHKFFGNQKFSKKRRSLPELSILETKGKGTIICELQGQLFFGTTDQLFTELEPNLSRCSFVVLDMRRVQSLDLTAANMLKQIHNRIQERGGYLILTSIPLSLHSGQNIKSYLEGLDFKEAGMNLKFFPDLDAALEWVEDEILETESARLNARREALCLEEFDFFSGLSNEAMETLKTSMSERTFPAGSAIFHQGDANDELYFVRKGTVKIQLPLQSGIIHHLATLSRKDFFGEVSFLDKGPRSANAVAVTEVMLFVLSRSRFDTLTENHPDIAAIFFERVSQTLSRHLRLTNLELMAIQDNG